MGKWYYTTLLVLFCCVHKSYEDCTADNIRRRQKCYYYDSDDYKPMLPMYDPEYYNQGILFPPSLGRGSDYENPSYNTDESACWTIIGTKVTCYRQKTIPRIEKCTMLEILDSDIHTITLNSFRNIPDLTSIKLTNCNVSKLEPGAFNGVNKLQNLSLSNNDINSITKGTFNQLIYLKKLNASMNKINVVEEGSFLGPDLKEIYINNNEIEEVSPFVEDCQKLEVFDVSYNKISLLESIGNCTSLIELYASNNHIKKLPPDLFTQLPLQILDLSSNILGDIDIDAFNGLDDLNSLDLSGNRINNGQLKIGIFQHLVSLLKLNLSSNSLTTLQFGIFTKLSRLQFLDVSNNQLISLSNDIFHDVDNLRRLYINNNLFTSFNGPPLEELNIDFNPLNCQELSRIVKFYKNAIIRGSNHNTSNIYGISCIPVTAKDVVPDDKKSHENDKIGYETVLGEFLDSNKELFRQNENISTSIQDLLNEFQNNNNKNQNLFSSIQQYLDQNQENFERILQQNQNYQNSSNAMKDFFKDIVKQAQNSSNMLKELLSRYNNNASKQTDQHDSINLGPDILKQFSEKVDLQFEKLLSIFNRTFPEKELAQSYLDLVTSLNNTFKQEIIKSEKLGGNIVVPHVTVNSNVFVGVLVVLIVFLIAFCLTVFYFIRSVKINHHTAQMDEVQL